MRRLEFALMGVAVLLGLCRAWAGRNGMMDLDGLSYIDIGKAYFRGEWHTALNPVWSPLYSWLIGLGLKVFNPSMYWEFPVVQLINFLIYLATLGCFRFFLHGAIRCRRSHQDEYPQPGLAPMHEFAWIALGYAAFIVGALEMIQVTNVRPDMCVAAFFFLASGIVVRIHTSTPGWRIYFVLGVCLGLGYLAKAALFPLAFTFIIASFPRKQGLRKGLILTFVAMTSLALVASPYVHLLSKRQGHLTFSEVAPLSYVWFVNNVTDVDFMAGNAPRYGKPLHPLRKIFDRPVAFEFADPVPGTYPVNFDPSYWWAGVRPHFEIGPQINRLAIGCYQLWMIVSSEFLGGLLAGILASYLLSPGFRLALRNMATQWFIILPPVAGMAMYALVYVQPRYVGSFFAVICVGLISGLGLPDSPESRKVLKSISTAALLVTLLAVFRSTTREIHADIATGPAEWRVADYLHRTGIQPGDRVGRLHLGYNLGWALLAEVRVTSEVDLEPDWMEDYLTATDQLKAEVLRAVFQTGVKAIVADHPEGSGCETGWKPVEKTSYSVCTARSVPLRSQSGP